MNNGEKPIVNPYVILREEFDDWAILFNPDNGDGFGLNPTGVYVWKLLDGEHTLEEMIRDLRRDIENVPDDAGEHLVAFVEALARHALAEYEGHTVHVFNRDWNSRSEITTPTFPGLRHLTYECPQLVSLNSASHAAGGCPCSSGTAAACCGSGASPACPGKCTTGGAPDCGIGYGNSYLCTQGQTATTSCWTVDCAYGTATSTCGTGSGK